METLADVSIVDAGAIAKLWGIFVGKSGGDIKM